MSGQRALFLRAAHAEGNCRAPDASSWTLKISAALVVGSRAIADMRFGDELVAAGEVEVPKGHKATTSKELHLGLGPIEQLSAKTFDPSKHPDDYRVAVTKAVDAKVAENEDLTDEDAPVSREAANDGHHGQQGGSSILPTSSRARSNRPRADVARSSVTRRPARSSGRRAPRKAAAKKVHQRKGS